jgi:methylenetetrahydrofolate reductase (NADPH)
MIMTNLFREKLEGTNDFLLTFELVPGRSVRGRSVEKVLSFARQAKEEGLLDALSITDNPGGNPSLSPDVLGREIKEIGIDPIVHFACRDWNRYGAISRALQLDRLSIENLLIVTGDYPAEGPEGTAKPCFDLDSPTMLCMLDSMNNGKDMFCTRGSAAKSERTNFLLGAVVSCYKYAESEVINQYYKLLKKIHNGAKFAITQICYDARKFHELLKFLQASGCEIPVFGSVYLLNDTAASFMYKGGVPGAFVSDKLLSQVQADTIGPDKGRPAILLRTAKLIAVLKGLGYRGAHIAGAAMYEDIRSIILLFRDIQEHWRDFLPEFDFSYPGGFYLYEKDDHSGLNSTYAARKSRRSLRGYTNQIVMKAFHALLFKKKALHYPIIKRIARTIDNSKILRALPCLVEDISKSVLFDCQKCGDCALEDMAYLCPESQCPKFIRNGACGGSEKTRCEVRKERTCVWVRIYDRLKAHGEESKLRNNCIPPRNWALNGTSSWLNFYLDRDYHALGLPFCERSKQTH